MFEHSVMRRVRRALHIPPADDDTAALVRAAYLILLQREPDEAGLRGHRDEIREGGTWTQLLATLARSPEFAQLHASMDEPYNTALIRAVLRAVLWREPDEALVEHLAHQMSSGVSFAKLFAELVHSGQFAALASHQRRRERLTAAEEREELAIERRLAALEERVESLAATAGR